MIPTVRMYATEQQARDVAEKIADKGFDEDAISLITPTVGGEAEAVDVAIRDGFVPSDYRDVCAQALRRGRSIVAFKMPTFGSGQVLLDIMQSHGPVDTELLPQRRQPRQPAPLSDFLGIPTLTDRAPRARLLPARVDISFGMRTLSHKAAPLSSAIGFTTKAGRPRNSSMGLPLLSRNPAPLSSMFGLPLLTKGKRRR